MRKLRQYTMPRLEAPDSGCVFAQPIAECFDPQAKKETGCRLYEALWHLGEAKEERHFVLDGALLVEQAVGRFMKALMPGFAQVAKNHDFGFALRIGVARSLRICPPFILDGADVIRQLRNDFVHDLSISSFKDVRWRDAKRETGSRRLRRLLRILGKYGRTRASGLADREAFALLVADTVVGLEVYRSHAARARWGMQGEGFRSLLKAKRGKHSWRDLQSPRPTGVYGDAVLQQVLNEVGPTYRLDDEYEEMLEPKPYFDFLQEHLCEMWIWPTIDGGPAIRRVKQGRWQVSGGAKPVTTHRQVRDAIWDLAGRARKPSPPSRPAGA